MRKNLLCCALLLAPLLTLLVGRTREPASAQPPPGPAYRDPLAPIQGEWMQLHYEYSGQLRGEFDPRARFIIRGNHWETRVRGRLRDAGRLFFVPDWPGPYLAFDQTIDIGERRGQVVKAIMAVDGDLLYDAGADPGYVRPRQFETRGGDHIAFSVWHRIR